ncbi:MAG: hypothetical protein PWQ08_961 [Clostridiales bacterium]|nr:hypothetical protein [Clostridiales bacterium]
MVVINKEACIGCGQCMDDCILNVLTLKDGKALHTAECIQCGHCMAVCPVNAVTIPDYDMGDVEDFDKSFYGLDIDRLLHTIKLRRSLRNFAEKKVEQDKLEKLVQAARYTATGGNSQRCRFVVVQDDLDILKDIIWKPIEDLFSDPNGSSPMAVRQWERLYRLRSEKGIDYLFRNAPAVLYIAAESDIDAGLAAQNIELAAIAQGLGVMYNGYLTGATASNRKACQWARIEDKPIAICMLVGYPGVQYMRSAPRKKADVVWK